jgi:hypothetical protein
MFPEISIFVQCYQSADGSIVHRVNKDRIAMMIANLRDGECT